MSRALDQFFVQVKELIFLPLQVSTCVWAVIVISEKFTVFVNHENGLSFSVDFYLKAFAAGVFNIGGFAKNVCHDVW